MGLVAAVAVVMLIVGFLLGTRGRQIVQIASKLAQAVRSLTIRIPPQVSVTPPASPFLACSTAKFESTLFNRR